MQRMKLSYVQSIFESPSSSFYNVILSGTLKVACVMYIGKGKCKVAPVLN